jgi:hypothetical protein
MPKIPLSEGRHFFGNDPLAYANGRPDYPEELYHRLRIRCELGPGISAFEIGAGTGLATQRLLALGVSRLWAIDNTTVRRSPFAVRRSPFAVRRSPFAVRRSPFAVRQSPFTFH